VLLEYTGVSTFDPLLRRLYVLTFDESLGRCQELHDAILTFHSIPTQSVSYVYIRDSSSAASCFPISISTPQTIKQESNFLTLFLTFFLSTFYFISASPNHNIKKNAVFLPYRTPFHLHSCRTISPVPSFNVQETSV
jgi:hypothetical protein